MSATMARFGGFIVRYVGDGELIYFGGRSGEADAERAVRAALAVISKIGEARPAKDCGYASGERPVRRRLGADRRGGVGSRRNR